MRRATVAIAAAFVTATAWAGDAAPPAKDAVEIKLAAKVGDVFRFRGTASSRTDVDGKPFSGTELTQEYVIKVKAVRPDGGVDVDATFELIHNRMFNPATKGWLDTDTSKPDPVGADMQAKATSAFARAIVGLAFKIALDARGAPTSVGGLREAARASIKAAKMEEEVPIDELLTDAECMHIAESLFAAAPAGAHVVGAKWTSEASADLANQRQTFSVESTLSAATADGATVAAKYMLKPSPLLTAIGGTALGGGDATARYARKDGLVLSMKRHLEANIDAGTKKSISHADETIERLPPAAPKPADPPTKK